MGMKVWTKVHIKDKNKQVELISKAFTNYLYTYGPILNIFRKYGVSLEDKKALHHRFQFLHLKTFAPCQ